MILFLAVTLAVAQAGPPLMQEEIVVIGQRLSRWTGKYEIRGLKMKCATKTSTNDFEIDAIGCQAFLTCADSLHARISASDYKALDKQARLVMKQQIKIDLTQCVKDRRAELIGELAAQRSTSRANSS